MDWIGYLTAGGIGGGIVQVFRAVLDWRRGTAADEREARALSSQERKDAATSADLLADNLQAALDKERARLDLIEARVDSYRSRHQHALDYINQLRQDILDGRPPPPREWPEGVL